MYPILRSLKALRSFRSFVHLQSLLPNLVVMIEDAIQDLLCEITITTRRLRKRPPANSTPKTSTTLYFRAIHIIGVSNVHFYP